MRIRLDRFHHSAGRGKDFAADFRGSTQIKGGLAANERESARIWSWKYQIGLDLSATFAPFEGHSVLPHCPFPARHWGEEKVE
jgi:hypothetical protein